MEQNTHFFQPQALIAEKGEIVDGRILGFKSSG